MYTTQDMRIEYEAIDEKAVLNQIEALVKKFVNAEKENSSQERARYHLVYLPLIMKK